MHAAGMIFRKEPFFYGHDNYDQLVKIAKVQSLASSRISCLLITENANPTQAQHGLKGEQAAEA